VTGTASIVVHSQFSSVPTKEDNHLVYNLSLAMSGFFDDEDARMSKFRAVLNNHGFDLTTAKVEGTKTDGDTRVGGFRVLVVEGKVEIAHVAIHRRRGQQYVSGSSLDRSLPVTSAHLLLKPTEIGGNRPTLLSASGAKPLFRGAQYYLEFVRNKVTESKHSLPCFILHVFGEYFRLIGFHFSSEPSEGAHIGSAGAAFTDHPILQVLTAPVPLFFHVLRPFR
jgi:hypothetical protein